MSYLICDLHMQAFPKDGRCPKCREDAIDRNYSQVPPAFRPKPDGGPKQSDQAATTPNSEIRPTDQAATETGESHTPETHPHEVED